VRHTSVPTSSPSTAPHALAALGGRQHGVARTPHLRAIGLNSSAVSKWTARGLLHPKYPGVHAIGHTALSREGELLAAVFAGGDGALLSHFACAELRRLRRRPARVIDVLVPRRHRPIAGIRFHVARSIHWRDVSEVDGVPATSVPRLCVDLST
jgi:hypothetical protein